MGFEIEEEWCALLLLKVMEDDWVEAEEEVDVHVLVLSPRCWTVSALCFMDEPGKHFPAELCSYLNEFTQFYTYS